MNDTRLLPRFGCHRGLQRPLVTIPNHESVIRPGISVEIDVHLCGDEIRGYNTIVIHEADLRLVDGVIYRAEAYPNLDKTHAPSPEMIEALTQRDLERLQIATLVTWLEVANDDNSGLVIIELKGSSVEMVVKLAEIVDSIIIGSSISYDKVAVKSFCIEAMAKIAELQAKDPEDERVALGLLWSSSPEGVVMEMHLPVLERTDAMDAEIPWSTKGLTLSKRMGMDFISVHWSMTNDEFLAVARRLDLEVCTWVVGDVAKARELAAKGVYVLTESQEVVEALQAE